MAKKLFVSNFPFTATESQLNDLFSQYGSVVSVKVINDRETGRSRGFGFVEMENADEAMNQLNGKDFGGRQLRINEAQERERRPQPQGDRPPYRKFSNNYNR